MLSSEEDFSVVEVLRSRSFQTPGLSLYTFLEDGEQESARLTCAELDLLARSIGAALQARGLREERVLLLFPPGLEFTTAFYGSLYGGAIAVPAYPPRQNRRLERLLALVRDARPRAALTTAAVLDRLRGMLADHPELAALDWLALEDIDPDLAGRWEDPGAGPETLAFLQYTSGSTATPKGVMVSHGNLLHNERMIRAAFGQSEESVIVGWLPLYHDMGLIGNVLQPLYVGARCVLMSPVSFLHKPLRWLAAISRYGGTTSGGPNFAYDLCVRKIGPAEREGLDLRSWTVAFNGAEPVRAETLDRFAAAFAPCGFRREAFFPCYGLAEATLFVAGGTLEEPPVVRPFAAAALERDMAVAVDANDRAGRALVGCGRAGLGQEVRVVDAATAEACLPGRVGEIWVTGPSVAQGYWERAEESTATFGAILGDAAARRWLRTGDLGFQLDGELYVTGRLKELVILRGRNFYPQDLEVTAEKSHADLLPGCAAAFSIENEGEERLVLACEVSRRRRKDFAEVSAAIRRAVAEEHEVHVYGLALLREGTLPKTTSGKIQRRTCRALWHTGELTALDVSVLVGALPWRDEAPPSLHRAEVLACAPAERPARLAGYLRDRVAAAVGALPAPDQPLVSLGLDSLAAAELEAALAADLGAAIPAAELLDGATVESLTDSLLAAVEQEAASPPQPAASLDTFPLSEGQHALWFLEQAAPGSGIYNIALAARANDLLDATALRRAAARLVIRHASLRTVVALQNGEPVQRIAMRTEPDFLDVDASGWTAEELAARLEEEAWRPFDLAGGSLLRLRLFRDAGGMSCLSLVVHHLIADFASLSVIARELGALYAEETGGPAALLPPPALGYADFVRWQAERLSRDGERLWEHWRERLAGPPPDLDLPTDQPRPPVQNYRGAAQALELSLDLAAEARALAAASEATPFMVFLAAFAAVLHRYSGQEDFVIGSPAAGRSVPGFAGMVGYFVNPLPLRARLEGSPSFSGLLARTRQMALAAVAHADYPFRRIAERLRPARAADRQPLFQVLLVLQGGRADEDPGLGAFALGEAGAHLDLGGLRLESLRLRERRTPFDLTLRLAPLPDGTLGASLEHNVDLFDGATARRLLGHFEILLAAAVADPGRPIASLPMLSEAEREQLVRGWNDTERAPGALPLLHEAFAAQARRTPEAEALVAGEVRWTYRDLAEQSRRLARRLVRLGVGPEVRVGVCLGRSPEVVMSLLAVLEAGGAYVPLDPAHPRERLEMLLVDSEARVLLSDGAAPVDLGGPDLPRIDPRTALAEPEDPGAPGSRATPGNLAYLIYTSGSTGRPKAVGIEHRSAAAFLAWAVAVFTPDELSGVLFSTSVGFDLSVFEIFVPLARGGRIVLAANALELPRLPAASEVTLVNTVPSAMAELVRSGGLPSGVTTINLAGEPIPASLAEALSALPQLRRTFNLYGPSEDTTYSTMASVVRGGAPPIGRPIAGSRAYGVDARGELVPAGVPGELWLGGAGLARAYLGRPDLTAERFIPDPFGGTPGERLYRTGDLVRRRPDGVLDFLGRIDHQVKVRGFRIELGEVEAALGRHPGVRETVVVARQDGGPGQRLIAYVVPREAGPDPSSATLRAFLARTLPEHMVPAAFVRLPVLPLLPNGKVDRKALPAPVAVTAVAHALRDPIEEVLAELWADLLGVERVGPDDQFFDLGGHSLLAARLVHRVRETLGVELPVSVVFEAPALAGLALRVREVRGGPVAAELVPVARDGALPPSFAQQRLWFLDQIEPGSSAYNIPGALRLRGALDSTALEGALSALVERHEALRTTFPAVGGQPLQRIEPHGPWTLRRTDLSSLPPAAREATATALADQEARRPFDLARGPLLRTILIRLDGEDHLLLVTLHHIVADGWSLGVLLRDLASLYGTFAAGEAPCLPALPVQAADWAVWQRDWMQGETLSSLLAWWRERLGSEPLLVELPSDRPRAAFRRRRGGQRPVHVPGPVADGIRAVCRATGATLFMGLLAAFDTLLARHTGAADLSVGFPVANRGRREVESLIGLFVNTLVLRIGVGDDPGFEALLTRVRAGAVGAWAHQDLPFELLVQELAPERHLGQSPLFQVLLSLQGEPPPLDLPGLQAESREVFNGEAKFDASLLLSDGADGISGTLNYDASLFDAATVDRWIARFGVLLSGVIADPGTRISRLPLLPAAELHQVLFGWNEAAAAADPGERCLHEIFAEQAVRTPDAPAVVVGEVTLTFAELDRQADRLARRLRRLGVAPDDVIGLCVGRTPDLLVGILGIWKSGGAYLPLDSAQPRERLAYTLDDAGARLLVTREDFRAALPAGPASILLDADQASEEPARPSVGPAFPDQLAYVIYTSGSTGRPKGTLIRHRSVANLVAALDRAVYEELGGPPLRVGLNASFTFDASVKQIVQVVRGRTLCIVPEAARLDGISMARFVAAERVDVLDCTPSQLRALLESGLDREALPRALLLGGEAVDEPLWRRLAADPGIAAFNLYGPTECTVDAVACRLTPGVPALGRPIAGVAVYVVDLHREPVPPGVAGELWIGGAGVARGYHGRPELTAEKLVPDAWSGVPGARLYRTGDLARWRTDGRIEFLGRADHQVKVRGFRIEPGEIEEALARIPGIREAVVVPCEEAPGDVRLVAYLTGSEGAPAADALRARLRELLPEPLVPSAFVRIETLPLAASGKVDRAALAQMAPPVEVFAPAEAPAGDLEQVLAGLWASVLGVAHIGPEEDFFALGGHSLLSTRLVHRVREILGADLPVASVFGAPTPRAFAARLREVAGGVVPPIIRAEREGPLPLSFAQQRLWFLDQLEPGSPAYNIPAAVRLTGRLDSKALERSFSEILRRHEVLRTAFPAAGGSPLQEVAEAEPWHLPVVDLSGLTAMARHAETERLARSAARHPFDLARGPLLRTFLLRQDVCKHLLLATLHHIVSDGWSTGVLLDELATLYEAFLAGRPSPLPDLPVQYADWAVWQRRWLADGGLESRLAHWQERLAGAPVALELPADRIRPAVPSGRGSRLGLSLPPDLTDRLHALARSEGATPFMVLLAGFDALLFRLTGAHDLLVGTPVANRERSEVRGLIGFFANTLVLRVDLSGSPSARGLVERVRKVAFAAYAYQDLPFELLVEALAPERSLGRNPLFQVMLALFGDAIVPRLAGVEAELVRLDPGIARFDLFVGLGEGPAGWTGAIEYSTDLFDASTVSRLAGHLAVLLAGACASPGTPVTALPLLSEAERHQLGAEWNDTAADPAPAPCLQELFSAQAARSPSALALVGPDGEEWSYGELALRASCLAGRLVELGVGPESVVGVLLDRQPELVVGLLGVLWAGGAYLPLDPSYPAERLAFMVEDGGAAVVVSGGGLAARLPSPGVRVVDAGEEGPEVPPVRVAGESLAYVIYTSGTTGRPKGVGIVHGGAVELVRWTGRRFSQEELSGVLAATSICFDLSVFELLAPLCLGGTVVLAADALHLASLPAAGKVRLINTVPSAIAELARLGAIPESVTTVCLAGEPLRGALVERVYAASRAGRLLNLYGPSEDTTYTTWAEVARGEPSPPIGRPLERTRIHLVGEGSALVPAGVAGELLIGSASLARGYLKRPELTAERFVPDPFGEEPGGRLYRTGDLARWRADGMLEILGRIDHQVKVRGFRIEPGEIERQLELCPGVGEAVVMIQEDGSGDRRLVAFVEVAGQGASSIAGWREALRHRLPEHMVPSAFVVLERLPRTPNGKVDRRALPAAQSFGEARMEASEGPRRPVEELLCGLWEGVLGVSRVGVHDDFFALGGHSLLATRLVARVREAFGRELPVRQIFATPTVAGLAAWLAGRDGTSEVPPILPAPRDGGLPLSFAQHRLWFLEQLEPGRATYNLPLALSLEGTLDADRLAGALATAGRRHETLRTHFAAVGGNPIQRVEAEPPVLGRIDLSSLPGPWRYAEAERLASEEARQPFQVAGGPLARWSLLRLSGQEHLLLITLHHAIADGWSLGVLLRDLGALYAGAALPELLVQYGDWAVWQLNWLQGEALEHRIAEWRERLADAPQVLDLPTDRPRPAVSSGRGDRRPLELPAPLTAALEGLARHAGATLFMMLLAGFEALLLRLTGQRDLVLGTVVAGRSLREVEDLVGFFSNTLALRVSLDPEAPFRDALARSREVALSAYALEDLPFEKLVEALRPERRLSVSPLFQVLFVLHSEEPMGFAAPGLRARLAPLATGTAKFDLTLGLARSAGAVTGAIEYSTDLFDAPTVSRLAGHLAVLLAGACASPETPAAALPLLSEAERHQLGAEWNDTAADPAPAPCLQELFSAQAARSPSAVALEGLNGEEWSYGELARRASRLAGRLVELGVGPESVVGVLLDRRPELVVGLLGVLWAGGAYLPLDPSYPAERLAFMVEDGGAAVVVSGGGLAAHLSPHGVRVVDVEEDGPEVPPVQVARESLAYIIYTSGTTGRPKGVGIVHGGAVELVRWTGRRFSQEELSGVLAATSICFDLSVFELLAPLCLGGTVILAADALHLASLPAAGKVRLINTVPSAIAELARLGAIPESVTTVCLAGEPLRGALVERVYAASRADRLLNLYGPSEDTTYTTWSEVTRGEPSPPIGRPLERTRIHLTGEGSALVPAGVAGELLIGSASLARGYLGRPELTAERFVPDPFGKESGGRLYRTGDLARWRADGVLEILGRIDHQVKVRGFRIEPGEIERQLELCSGVGEAVVVVQEDGAGDRRLVAFVEVAGQESPSIAGLREALRHQLPEHMVPSAFVVLERLPRTPNGKVDRRALPAAQSFGEARMEASEGPRRPVEELLCGLWEGVLGVSRVGFHDDFFALGGHSLLATRLVARVREAFSRELPVRQIFATPTVAGLAAWLAGRDGTAEVPPILPAPRDGGLPLSFAQHRLWFLEQLEPAGSMYNVPAAVALSGPLVPSVLASALASVTARHEALRTTFTLSGAEPVQVIVPPPPPSLPVVDLAGLPSAWRSAEARRLVGEEAHRPFDLELGPLLRAVLLRRGVDDHVLSLTLHHIVSDGWSLEVLVRDLAAFCGAAASGRPAALPALPVQYADFAVWQRERLRGELRKALLGYWQGQLSGVTEAFELPSDRPRIVRREHRGRQRSLAIPSRVVDALRRLGREAGTTLFMSLFAAFQVLLARYAGREDLVVGTPIANRDRLESENLIGFFVNLLALRSNLGGDPSFHDLLARVREVCLGAYTHQDLPFELLVQELAPERQAGRSPLFQVMFLLQSAPLSPALPGLRVELEEVFNGRAKLDVSLAFAERDGGLTGWLTYDAGLFDETTMARLSRHLEGLLEAAAAGAGRRLSQLPMLSPEERFQLAVEWSEALPVTPPGTLLHQVFEGLAAREPEAVALIHGRETISRGELDSRSAALACRLRRLGVGPDVLVGVCTARTPEMVVALLAVLRAGGAYLPLDPSYPAERLRYLLSDAGASVVLTESSRAADLAQMLSDGDVRVVAVDDSAVGAAEETAVAEHCVLPDHLAYVIYTSGSTGRPKGVAIRHSSAVALVEWAARAFSPAELQGVLAATSLSFDLSVFELFAPLSLGGRVILADDLLSLPELPAACEVTLVNAVPSPMTALLHLGGLPASVATVSLAGEPLPAALVERLHREPGVRRVLNLYGPSEDTTYSTGTEVQPGEGMPGIGWSVDGKRSLVLGRDLEPVPSGVAGEIFVGGAGLARGYLGRPDLTAERFVPDPFAARRGEPGERLYRTGDLGRRRTDGRIEFLGRIDSQVKVRGFRIELGEVEAAIVRLPGVAACAAAVRRDGLKQARLVAYVVADVRAEVAGARTRELRQALAAHLPGFMVPSVVVFLQALPLTPHGKLDRSALPEPVWESAEAGAVAPRNPVEEELVRIWSEVLGIPGGRLGVHDDFFELGGHSLLGTHLVNRVRQAFEIELPQRAFFNAPTIAGLAEAIGQRSRAAEYVDALDEILREIEALPADQTARIQEPEGRA